MGLFSGAKIIEEVKSDFNGKISVVKSLSSGISFQVEGLTQSGSVVSDVWNTVLKKIKSEKEKVNKCLILGLGGGSAAKLVRKYWPNSKITGIDIDPVIVNLGSKYLNLDEANIDVEIVDARKYLTRLIREGRTFDLVLIDMYVGHEIPKEFTENIFVLDIKKIVSETGLAVFNRLYFGENRKDAQKFAKKLEKTFSEVTYIYPEANVMFIAR